jgi:hypothetical protein
VRQVPWLELAILSGTNSIVEFRPEFVLATRSKKPSLQLCGAYFFVPVKGESMPPAQADIADPVAARTGGQ